MIQLLLFGTLIGVIVAAPGSTVEIEKTVSSSGGPVGIPPLFSFDNGNVGVNFLGFRASAGLGGLLTGNAADGGLHAEAGTPYGQAAGAGLGGTVDGYGNNGGYRYGYARNGPSSVLKFVSSALGVNDPYAPPEIKQK